MGQWEGKQFGRTVWDVMSLRSWQNIKERHLGQQDWGSGRVKGRRALAQVAIQKCSDSNALGDVTFGCSEVNTHTPTYL